MRMAKSQSNGKQGTAPLFHATVRYKSWVREQLKARKWALQDLVDAIKRIDRQANATTAGLSQFLGPLDGEVAPPSNTSLMPAINKVFKLAPPPICDPTDQLSQLRDRLAARWSELTPREQDAIVALLRDGGDETPPD